MLAFEPEGSSDIVCTLLHTAKQTTVTHSGRILSSTVTLIDNYYVAHGCDRIGVPESLNEVSQPTSETPSVSSRSTQNVQLYSFVQLYGQTKYLQALADHIAGMAHAQEGSPTS